MEPGNRSISVKALVGGIIAFGVLSISLVIYSQWLGSRDFAQNTSLVRMTQVIAQEIATAHLWFEEALGGDRTIYLDEDVHVPNVNTHACGNTSVVSCVFERRHGIFSNVLDSTSSMNTRFQC